MGTVKNGVKWSGACVNGEVIMGAAKGGNVFYRRGAYILLEYTDTSNIKHSEKFSDSNDLKSFIQANSSLFKTIKLYSKNGYKLTVMLSLFKDLTNVSSIDISNVNTEGLDYMSSTFENCNKLTSVLFGNINTSEVFTMAKMFKNCSSIQTVDVSKFDVSNVSMFNEMFYGCTNLRTIYCNNNWDLGNSALDFDMFSNCSNLKGAVSFNSSKTGIDMANPTNGYFTRK